MCFCIRESGCIFVSVEKADCIFVSVKTGDSRDYIGVIQISTGGGGGAVSGLTLQTTSQNINPLSGRGKAVNANGGNGNSNSTLFETSRSRKQCEKFGCMRSL
jgi:hypothetical protein